MCEGKSTLNELSHNFPCFFITDRFYTHFPCVVGITNYNHRDRHREVGGVGREGGRRGREGGREDGGEEEIVGEGGRGKREGGEEEWVREGEERGREGRKR